MATTFVNGEITFVDGGRNRLWHRATEAEHYYDHGIMRGLTSKLSDRHWRAAYLAGGDWHYGHFDSLSSARAWVERNAS